MNPPNKWRDVSATSRLGHPVAFELRVNWLTLEIQHFVTLGGWCLLAKGAGIDTYEPFYLPVEAADEAKRRAVEMVTERLRRMATMLGGYR